MKKSLAAISALTMVVLYGMLGIVIALICYLCNYPAYGAIGAVIIVMLIQFLISPWLTDLNMKWFYKAKFDAPIPDYLRRFIEETCESKNMKYPKVAVIYDGAPNAFTYGRTKNDARIVITQGIFDLLDEEEVKSVVAHEIGHAVHYDMLLMTVVQLVPMALYAIYDACMSATKSAAKRSSDDDDKAAAGLALIGLVALLLYVISEYVILWFSRTREYYADDFSARATQNPAALASALIQIGLGLSTRKSSAKSDKMRHSASSPSALGISDVKTSAGISVCALENGSINREYIKEAMKWDLWNVWAKLYELSSTHPLVSKRVLALGKVSEELGQQPYVDFDLEKPESYVDDFFRELVLIFLPSFCLIAGVIAGIILLMNPVTVNTGMVVISGGIVLAILASLLKFRHCHPGGYEPKDIKDLLGEVKVSGITSIACELDGEIIGRGNPGCIFNEDYVLQDDTGIMLLDYDQPLRVVNKIFAIFKSAENFHKQVHVVGWYRRKPIPYVEIKSYEVDGKIKKCHSVTFGYVWRYILLVLAAIFFAFCLLAML